MLKYPKFETTLLLLQPLKVCPVEKAQALDQKFRNEMLNFNYPISTWK